MAAAGKADAAETVKPAVASADPQFIERMIEGLYEARRHPSDSHPDDSLKAARLSKILTEAAPRFESMRSRMEQQTARLLPKIGSDLEKIDAIAYAKAARLTRALERSKASYESWEMRMRAWMHNRTVPSYLFKAGDKDPLLAKMLRAVVTGGAAYVALKWVNGVSPELMKSVVDHIVPELVRDTIPPGVLPAIAGAIAGAKGTISKFTLESTTQLPRFIDYLRLQHQVRKIDNREWFQSNMARLKDNPFYNFDDLRSFCKDVVREVHPAKQTKMMEAATESTLQVDFWAKDLAIRIAEAASAADGVTLEHAMVSALNAAPWATKTLSKMEIVHKTDDEPTAYGRTEFRRSYKPKDEFAETVKSQDLDLVVQTALSKGAGIRERIAGYSARLENAMAHSQITTNLLAGDGAASSLSITAGGLLALAAASTADPGVRAAATYMNQFMVVAPSVLIGALTVRAPLHIAQMCDRVALMIHKTRNLFEHDRMRLQDENWNDPNNRKSLAELRQETAKTLDRWRNLHGLEKPQHVTGDTERVAQDLMVEKLLNKALQYKLLQPRLPLGTVLKGVVAVYGFSDDMKPLQSLERPQPGTMPIPKQPITEADTARRLKQHLARTSAEPETPAAQQPAKRSPSL